MYIYIVTPNDKKIIVKNKGWSRRFKGERKGEKRDTLTTSKLM